MTRQFRWFYGSSLAILLAAAAYPIYMGVQTVLLYRQNGFLAAADYPKYIIPYTPLSLAVLIVAAVYPLIWRWTAKSAQLIGSALGTAIFLGLETSLEQIKVVEGYQTLPLQSWQYSLCIATPEVLRTIGEPIYAERNPAFKVHFYLIAWIIILAVVGLIDGYTRAIQTRRAVGKHLVALTILVTAFVGLCILACRTAFYRTGQINLSAQSAAWMSLFFIVYGLTFGTYLGVIRAGRGIWSAVILPGLTAAATTGAMYGGELVLMDGRLFRLGQGLFFQPAGNLPLAWVDWTVILLSGIMTGLLMLGFDRHSAVSGRRISQQDQGDGQDQGRETDR